MEAAITSSTGAEAFKGLAAPGAENPLDRSASSSPSVPPDGNFLPQTGHLPP